MNDPYVARLSIGEIFDRAVHIVLRNFLQLSLAYGIFFIPTRALHDWVQRAEDGRFDLALGTVVANPHLLSQFFRLSTDPTRKSTAFDWMYIALELAVNVLAACLVANVTLRIVRGEHLDTFQAIPKSLGVWHRLVALQFIVVLAVIVAVFMWVIPALIWPVVRSPGVLLATTSVTAALLFCAFEAWGFCAFGAIALDGAGTIQAMRTGWRMTMSRTAASRSFAFGFGILAFYLLALLLSFAAAGFTVILTHQVVPARILQGLLVIAGSVFVNVAGIVFYLDAKARYAAIQDAARNRENSAAR